MSGRVDSDLGLGVEVDRLRRPRMSQRPGGMVARRRLEPHGAPFRHPTSAPSGEFIPSAETGGGASGSSLGLSFGRSSLPHSVPSPLSPASPVAAASGFRRDQRAGGGVTCALPGGRLVRR